MQWLHLRFAAPMASFGGDAIDAYRATRLVPAQSMLTGLLANALGWTRVMRREHESLQRRIRFASAWDTPSQSFTDYQTAQLDKAARAWTTHGKPAGRKGGSKSGSHQRWVDYHADIQMTLVLTVTEPANDPTPEQLAGALQSPARPLFFGRKTCLPAAPIYQGMLSEFPNALSALQAAIPAGSQDILAHWSESESHIRAMRTFQVVDLRNWWTRLHGGGRIICEGRISSLSEGD